METTILFAFKSECVPAVDYVSPDQDHIQEVNVMQIQVKEEVKVERLSPLPISKGPEIKQEVKEEVIEEKDRVEDEIETKRDERNSTNVSGAEKSEEETEEADSESETEFSAVAPPLVTSQPKQRTQYKCGECPREFRRKRDLDSHTTRHTGQKPFKCNQCGLFFARKDNLRKHVCRGSEGLFNCEVCGRSYTHRGYLLMHLKSAHSDRCLTCTVCGRSFVLNSHLLSHKCFHIREVQGGEELGHREQGDERGERREGGKRVEGSERSERDKEPEGRNLKEDETKMRKEESRFICSVCGKTFGHNASLYRHMRIHSGERPHTCPLCSKTFPWPSDLKRHLKYHTPTDRPFVCETCGRAFIVNEALISHRRTHSLAKPFSCSVCGKGFTRRHQLKEHGRLHNQLTEYRCAECGHVYRKQGALHNHLRKQHGRMVTTEVGGVTMETEEQKLDEEDAQYLQDT